MSREAYSPDKIERARSAGLISDAEADQLLGSTGPGLNAGSIAGAGLGLAAGAATGVLGGKLISKGLKGLGAGINQVAQKAAPVMDKVGMKGLDLGMGAGGGIAGAALAANAEDSDFTPLAAGAIGAGVGTLGSLVARKSMGSLAKGAQKAYSGALTGAGNLAQKAGDLIDTRQGALGSYLAGGTAGALAGGVALGNMAGGNQPSSRDVEQLFAILTDPNTDPKMQKRVVDVLMDLGYLSPAPSTKPQSAAAMVPQPFVNPLA